MAWQQWGLQYPPLAPQSSIRPIWPGRGFWHLPGSSQGLPVFSCFNVGETRFFDTKFYSDPTGGGVFSQKTLLQPPSALQFSLSAGDVFFSQPELDNGFLLPSLRQTLSQVHRPLNQFSGLLIPTGSFFRGAAKLLIKAPQNISWTYQVPHKLSSLQVHDLKRAFISMKFRPATPRKRRRKAAAAPKGEVTDTKQQKKYADTKMQLNTFVHTTHFPLPLGNFPSILNPFIYKTNDPVSCRLNLHKEGNLLQIYLL